MSPGDVATDVYVGDELVGNFSRDLEKFTEFDYLEGATTPVATTLPLSAAPYATAAGALPPFYQPPAGG